MLFQLVESAIWRFWVNTKDTDDIAWMRVKVQEFEKITLDERFINHEKVGTNENIRNFFDMCCEPDSVYLRLDDDIVWLEPNFLKKMFEFREQSQSNFLVFGNIINNAVIDHLHQRQACLTDVSEHITYECMCPVGWSNPDVALQKHNNFIRKFKSSTLQDYYFNNWVLFEYNRVSINCISWLGQTFSEFGGVVEGLDEEQWLSVDKPKSINVPNIIFGSALCVHYSFFTQREFLDSTSILSFYTKLAESNTEPDKDYLLSNYQLLNLLNSEREIVKKLQEEISLLNSELSLAKGSSLTLQAETNKQQIIIEELNKSLGDLHRKLQVSQSNIDQLNDSYSVLGSKLDMAEKFNKELSNQYTKVTSSMIWRVFGHLIK